MQVLVNAVSVREGGSLVVLKNLLAEMTVQQPQWEWHVATNEQAGLQQLGLPRTTCHLYPVREISGWRVRLWYETSLPRLAKDTGAALLFSQTNYLPTRRLPCPSLLLVQHAGHFSERFSAATQAGLSSSAARLAWKMKGQWVRSSVLQAQAVTVQTEALAVAMRRQTGIRADQVHVIAHGPGQAHTQDRLPPQPPAGKPVRVGYVTKIGVQKNFAVLFRAAAELKIAGHSIQVVLTLRENTDEARQVLDLARQWGIGDCVENHGELAGAQLDRLYQSLHIFVFPSWCESFGFPLVEAMTYGLPLLVADTPSNRELTGAAGATFEPDDAPALAALISQLVQDPGRHQAQARASRERSAQFSWQHAAAQTLALMADTCLVRETKS